MDKLIITPKTKIFDLLQAYPQLEDVLIDAAPQFKKLKNPVLRKTVTKIANLNQAAGIAGINVEELVNKLRKEVGQDKMEDFFDNKTKFNTTCPDWFNESNISSELDIRDMLREGEHPVHEVLSEIRNLENNQILKIIAPFIPAPLIDKSLSLGANHWINKIGDEEYEVFFIKS